MEPILLYGHPLGSSLGLVAALEWLGRPYRLCRVDMLGDMRRPAFGRLNPRHETPVLVTDEGEVLTESMAIGFWLEARDAERRISFEPLTRDADRIHQLMAFVNTGFTAAFAPLWAAMEMKDPDPAHQAALRRFGRQQVVARHDKLEAMIGDGPWLVGQRPSLADGFLAGVARWLEFHEVADISRWPRLQALRRRIEADPSVVFAAAVEQGEGASSAGACLGHIPLEEVITRFGR